MAVAVARRHAHRLGLRLPPRPGVDHHWSPDPTHRTAPRQRWTRMRRVSVRPRHRLNHPNHQRHPRRTTMNDDARRANIYLASMNIRLTIHELHERARGANEPLAQLLSAAIDDAINAEHQIADTIQHVHQRLEAGPTHVNGWGELQSTPARYDAACGQLANATTSILRLAGHYKATHPTTPPPATASDPTRAAP